jgi:hypothetical protein
MTENYIIRIENTQIYLNASHLKLDKYEASINKSTDKLFKELMGEVWKDSKDLSFFVAYSYPLFNNKYWIS